MLLTLAVIILAAAAFYLWTEVKRLDNNGKELTAWIGKVDDPTDPNALPTVGLTTWLINLKKHVTDHIGQKVTPAGAAHTGVHDMHLDPPPPPGW